MPAATEREQTEESIIRTMAMNGHPLRMIAKTLGRPATWCWHRMRALGLTPKKTSAALSVELPSAVLQSLVAAAARRRMTDSELASQILSNTIRRGSIDRALSLADFERSSAR